MYVEFPVDLIREIVVPKKKPVGTHPCAGEPFSYTGPFRENYTYPWFIAAGISGVDLTDPTTPAGIPIQGTVTLGGGEIAAPVQYPGWGPPQVNARPSYTNSDCGFDIGVSTDGVSVDVVESSSITIEEGDSGPFETLSYSFGPVPVGTFLYVAFRAHGGSHQTTIANQLLPTVSNTASFLSVAVTVEYICTGPAPSEVEIITRDSFLTRVAD
jgi:hypothetical protein